MAVAQHGAVVRNTPENGSREARARRNPPSPDINHAPLPPDHALVMASARSSPAAVHPPPLT